MGEIISFCECHIPDVAGLFLRGMQGRREQPTPALFDYFREMFFGNPWASAEFPSLVYMDKGKLIGFCGVLPREMQFRDKRISVAVMSQFVVDREQNPGYAQLALMRSFLRGPQDLSFCDGVSQLVHSMWVAAGATSSHLYSFNWLRSLRPIGTARGFASRLDGRMKFIGKVASAAMAPLDSLLSKLPVAALRPPVSNCVSTLLTSEQMYGCIEEVGPQYSLRPSYDLASFQWLMAQVEANRSMGDLLMVEVRDQDGGLCGYHISHVKRGGHAHVLQVGSKTRSYSKIIGAIFRDAWQHGACSVKGQAIPAALVDLTENYCLFRQAQTSVVFHSRDSDIRNAMLSGDAALSRLDGECWLRFATEHWV